MTRAHSDKNAEEAKKLREETNLFKFLLKGLKINVQLNVDKAKKTVVTSTITEMLKSEIRSRYLRFLMATLKSAAVRIKLSQEDTFDLFMEFLNDVKGKVPDGADLVDAFGVWLEKMRWADLLEQLPPQTKTMVGALIKHGVCDFKMGFTSETATVIYGMKSEGFLELYTLAMSGFK